MQQTTAKKLRYALEYLVIFLFFGLQKLLPFRWRVAMGGSFIGFLVPRLKKFRRRIPANLRHIYPDIETADITRITRAVARNFGRTFTEILNNPAYVRYAEKHGLFHVSGPGLEVLRQTQAAGRGAVIISGHFGQWEAIRHYCNSIGIRVAAVYRPNNNVHFDRFFLKNLEFPGAPIFPSGRRGTSEMIRYVRDGGVLAILTDQRVPGAPKYDFLGQPAETSTVAAKMALKHGVPLIPAYGVRRAQGLDIDITFEAPVAAGDEDTMTQALNDSLSAQVRAHPEQWYWLHQRWWVLG